MSHSRFETYLDALEPLRSGADVAACEQWRDDARARLERAEMLEAYLDELEAPLARQGLSAVDRDEWRAEARQHLLTLAQAHEELGEAPEKALRDALSSFGEASFIGAEVGRQTRRIGDRTGARRVAVEAATAATTAVFALGALIYLSLGAPAITQMRADTTGRIVLTAYALAAALVAVLALRNDRRAWQVAGAVFGVFLAPTVAYHAGMLPADLTDAASVSKGWSSLVFHLYLYGAQATVAGWFIWKKRAGALVAAFATAALDLAVTLLYWNVTSSNKTGWVFNPAQLGPYYRTIFIMGGIQHFALGLLLSWGRKGAGHAWRKARDWRARWESRRDAPFTSATR